MNIVTILMTVHGDFIAAVFTALMVLISIGMGVIPYHRNGMVGRYKRDLVNSIHILLAIFLPF